MHVVFFSQYFPPETCAPAIRVSENTAVWAESCETTVVCAFPHHPHGKKCPEDAGKLMEWQNAGKVSVLRCYVYATPNSGVCLRSLAYVSYFFSSIFLALCKVKRPSIVVATSPQLLCALAGFFYARLVRVPFVFEVRDLWPESVIAVNASRSPLLIGVLRAIARFLYRRCNHIVTVGDGYKNGIVRGYQIPEGKISVISNGVDLNALQRLAVERSTERMRLQLTDDHKMVLYLGTHGMAQGLASVIKAAEILREQMNISFWFVGDGAEKRSLISMAATLGLSNVKFVNTVSRREVRLFYAAADVCVIPLRKSELFKEVLPSKMFEAMAMQCPIISSVEGESKKLLQRAKAGMFVPPEDPVAMAAAVNDLLSDSALSALMGRNGRSFVEENFSRVKLAEDYLNLLKSIQSIGRVEKKVRRVA